MAEFRSTLAAVVDRFAADAPAVDLADLVPGDHFDALATTGLYGAFAPAALGGMGLTFGEMCDAVELLASGCLASTFVWIQHLRLLGAVLDPDASPYVRSLLTSVVRGETRGGVALTGLQPGPPRLSATRTPAGWALHGSAPWVSGWGLVDLISVAARGPEDTVVSVLVPAREQPGLSVTRRHLSALNATGTVSLTFESLEVADEWVVAQAPFSPANERHEGLRVNGSLALGLTRRCSALLRSSSLDEELVGARAALDDADTDTMASARARACELAVRAAHALAVQRGSSSVLAGDLAERTSREAAVLLTFGSRPAIRRSLLERFGANDVA